MPTVRLTSVVVVGVIATTGACSPDAGPPTGGADAIAVCPSTPEETIGAACAVPGLRCGPQYACGLAQVSLLCVCTGGTFQCSDGAGHQIANGGTPMCPQPATAGSCPSSEKSAQFAPCGEQGLLCAYQSPCAPSLDQCECFSGATSDGGTALRFECTPAVCIGPEAGPASTDSGSPIDAQDGSSPMDSSLDEGTDSGEAGGWDVTSGANDSAADHTE